MIGISIATTDEWTAITNYFNISKSSRVSFPFGKYFKINLKGKDSKFGEEILDLYGNIDKEKVKEYQNLLEEYYSIETIIYGIKNNKKDSILIGKKEINKRINKKI